VKNAKIVQLWV